MWNKAFHCCVKHADDQYDDPKREAKYEALNIAMNAMGRSIPSRWISVEERLPEAFRIVLCSDGERVFQAIYETGSKYFPDHWGEVICLDKNGGSTKHMHEPPTHWMPMPEPPKEE